jgi:hypothetical protein
MDSPWFLKMRFDALPKLQTAGLRQDIPAAYSGGPPQEKATPPILCLSERQSYLLIVWGRKIVKVQKSIKAASSKAFSMEGEMLRSRFRRSFTSSCPPNNLPKADTVCQ